MSELETEQSWDACESTSLVTKELNEKVTNGSMIYLASGKRLHLRRFQRLSCQAKIRNIIRFFYDEDS